jgi:peptidoglycan-associated lipoprotein
MNRSTLAMAFLLPALLLGACKKKQPPPVVPTPPPAVEQRLQVTSINPSSAPPETAVSARVYGSSFVDGATVTFSGAVQKDAVEVSVESPNTIELTVPPLPIGSYDVKVTNKSGESVVLRQGFTVKAAEAGNRCAQATVNFDFDRSDIRSDAKSLLDGNMSCYQRLTGPVRIEGHCDERGTTDYNIALGQRRADQVKQYLVRGGVSASRVSTTSYGEERPLDRASTEAAWAKNRRAEVTAAE